MGGSNTVVNTYNSIVLTRPFYHYRLTPFQDSAHGNRPSPVQPGMTAPGVI